MTTKYKLLIMFQLLFYFDVVLFVFTKIDGYLVGATICFLGILFTVIKIVRS